MEKIGIIGTGFIAKGISKLLPQNNQGLRLTKMLTRRNLNEIAELDSLCLTNSVQELIDNSDLIVECSGDAIHATEVLYEVAKSAKPIVTINAEFHVTTGSYFVNKTFITEGDGDQPGCLARLKEEVELMGFSPLVYVNIKGFLSYNPTRSEMIYWAKKQNLGLQQVVSFTDGSKLQIEQALVANGLGATIAQDGLIGGVVEDIRNTEYLAEKAKERGCALSDYVIAPGAPPGVFIVAESEVASSAGDYGPFAKIRTSHGQYFLLLKPYHLCHLEILKTIKRVMRKGGPLINNSARPKVSVGSIAKNKLKRGDTIDRALGSFKVRGVAVSIADNYDHVPICLLAKARVLRDIDPGQQITFEDVELPASKALDIYFGIREKVVREHNKRINQKRYGHSAVAV